MLVVGGDGGFHFPGVAYTIRHPPYFKASKLKDLVCVAIRPLLSFCPWRGLKVKHTTFSKVAFTSTETVRIVSQDGHLGFDTAPEMMMMS